MKKNTKTNLKKVVVKTSKKVSPKKPISNKGKLVKKETKKVSLKKSTTKKLPAKKVASKKVSPKKKVEKKIEKKSDDKTIPVLFENTQMLALLKPSGMSVHKDGKRQEYTLADYILNKYKKLKDVGENIKTFHDGQEVEIEKPGIVHRLDKDTTGVILVAKNQDSYENLKQQFQNHKVRKEYVALVYGDIKHETGIIDAKLARNKNDFRKKEVVKVTGGEADYRGEEREAFTRYKVLKRFIIAGVKVTLVTFFPETGRTHQIRIHTKSIGHPIVGDYLYGHKNEILEKEIFGKNKTRQLLHAKSLTLENPETGDSLKIEAPFPSYFAKIIA